MVFFHSYVVDLDCVFEGLVGYFYESDGAVGEVFGTLDVFSSFEGFFVEVF